MTCKFCWNQLLLSKLLPFKVIPGHVCIISESRSHSRNHARLWIRSIVNSIKSLNREFKSTRSLCKAIAIRKTKFGTTLEFTQTPAWIIINFDIESLQKVFESALFWPDHGKLGTYNTNKS